MDRFDRRPRRTLLALALFCLVAASLPAFARAQTTTYSYDGTLNDSAIRQAISEAVNRLSTEMASRPWQTFFLSADQGQYFVAGGKSQGLRPGMLFSVQTLGAKVKSPQTGFEITLPGREVAQLRIDSNFGDTEAKEGSVGSLVSGSIQGFGIEQLVIRIKEAS